MTRRRLLSIDGGGIRGVLPACALAKLESVTGRPARETFAFVAGTSTGAILSAALAAGIPAAQLVDLYAKRGRDIFFPPAPWKTVKRLVAGSMYSTRRLHKILCKEFGAARAWALNDSPVDILLTAKGVDGKPWYFVKDKLANSRVTGRFHMVDCATASASAPTYFRPWKIAGAAEAGALVDGGVGVTGNPVYQACVEAFYYTNEYTPGETMVVSLGTGRFPHRSQPVTLFGWLDWVLAELLRSPGEQQTELAARHFPQTMLYRLDPDIPQLDPNLKGPIGMDDVGSVARLVEYGRAFAAQIDWDAILNCSDSKFLVRREKQP